MDPCGGRRVYMDLRSRIWFRVIRGAYNFIDSERSDEAIDFTKM